MSGTYPSPTLAALIVQNGSVEINNGLGGTAISASAGVGNFGWLTANANGVGTVTYGTATVAGPGVCIIDASANVAGTSGTASPTASLVQIGIPSDTLNSSATANGFFGFNLNMNFGGASCSGSHGGMLINVTQTGTMSGSGFSGALNAWLTINDSWGGTTSSPSGNVIVQNGQLILTSGATSLAYATIAEDSVSVQSGATVAQKIGRSVALGSGDAVRGTAIDAAMTLWMTHTATGSWKYGYTFGKDNDQWPFATDSTLIGTVLQQTGYSGYQTRPQLANVGVNFSQVDFGTAAWISPGFTIDFQGNIYQGSCLMSRGGGTTNIDVQGSFAALGALVSGGTYGFEVGDQLYDNAGLGMIVNVTSVNGGGVIQAATIVSGRTGYYFGGSPPSTVTLLGGSGTGAVVFDVTWTGGNLLALNPGGQPITLGGVTKYSNSSSWTSSGTSSLTLTTGPTGTTGSASRWLTVIDNNGTTIVVPGWVL